MFSSHHHDAQLICIRGTLTCVSSMSLSALLKVWICCPCPAWLDTSRSIFCLSALLMGRTRALVALSLMKQKIPVLRREIRAWRGAWSERKPS